MPQQAASVKVHGLKELQRALKRYGAEATREIDEALKDAGEDIRQRATMKMSMIDLGSALGFKAKTKGFGRVVVEQSKRKRTGLHPEFGALQMRRALIPARTEGFDTVVEKIDSLLGRLGGEEGF